MFPEILFTESKGHHITSGFKHEISVGVATLQVANCLTAIRRSFKYGDFSRKQPRLPFNLSLASASFYFFKGYSNVKPCSLFVHFKPEQHDIYAPT